VTTDHRVTQCSKLDASWNAVSVDTLFNGEREAGWATAFADGNDTTKMGLEDVTGGRRGSPTSTTAGRPTPSTPRPPGCSCRTATPGRAPTGCAGRAHAPCEPNFRHRVSVVKEHHDEPDDKEHAHMVTEKAILAGGCFWGMQDLIGKLDGVVSTRVGYSGGDVPNATYRNHGTHAEAIEIVFDPERISYRELLEFFFQVHDPTTKNRQGNDIGTSYRSAIFYLDDEQRRVAEDTIADVDASGLWPGKVVTEVEPAGPFWEAEPEHQNYLERYPNGYTCHFVRPGWRLPKRAEPAAS
jgi:peptide-methionine (S)-S-oxide reductase